MLTTFSTNKSVYNTQLARLLSADKAIADGPYISISDPYDKGATLAELADEGIVSREILKLKKIYPQRPLYRHQEEAVRKAAAGSNLVVTTGTGSGKTESFLIPVINQLLKEKEAGTLGPGVRTLIIYPMNALVNDQIRRLRELLSEMEDGSKITFGRFTGETKHTFQEAYAKYVEIEDLDEYPLQDNELISREQMRATPPNILITNYAMLEYLLLRPGDNIIFSSEYAPHWQYIVFDEAHSYSGAKGIEVASLVRRVKAMLDRPDLQFILTSATLGDENANQEIIRFAHNLCGADFTDRSIVRAYTKKILPTQTVSELDYALYSDTAALIRDNAPEEEIRQVLAAHGAAVPQDAGLSEILFDTVLHDAFYYRVREALNGKIKTVKAVASELGLSEGEFTDFIAVASNAMRSKERLFEAKYHMFLRGMEGVFVTLNPSNRLFINRMETYKESPEDDGYQVFEVSFCSNCNALFITGEEKDGHLIQKSKFYDDYTPSVFMLSGEFDEDAEDDNVYQICAKCGAIKRKSSVNGLQCGHGPAYINYLLRVKKANEPLHHCPSCHSRNTRRSILRPYFLGNEAATAVIATALYNELPGEICHVRKEVIQDPFFGDFEQETRDVEKLKKQFLAFSDNRQTAAYFSTYLESTYRDSLIKRIMHQLMEEHSTQFDAGVSLKSFIQMLAQRFEAEALFPEETAEGLEKKAWICAVKELYNYKAKNSLLKKGGLCFEIDCDVPQLKLPLTRSECNDLFKVLARHMMRDAAVDVGVSLTKADVEEMVPSGFAKGYDATAAGYSYIEGWSPEQGKTNKRLKYLTKLLDGNEALARSLLGSVWNYLVQKGFVTRVSMGQRNAYQLNADRIKVRSARQLFRCTECGNVTPYDVKGICENPACQGSLVPYDMVQALENDHYFRLYTELEPVPMRVEEHTAQLSSDKAYEYQKDFKGKQINVLSCSTTFEMGVDLGSLETVFMRNMPPSPANYAQRAGRAGRSLKAAAYAITFCPNSSHDLNYFKDPVSMIRGNIVPPFFNVSNDKIVLRHIYASAFSFFWKANQTLYTDKIGDFFDASGFEKLRAYLDGKPQDLKNYLLQVVPQDLQGFFDVQNFGWVKTLFCDAPDSRGLGNIVADKYREEIRELETAKAERAKANKYTDSIVRSINTIKNQRIIEFLSKNNLIPKYGFPVDTVELQGASTGSSSDLRLSRDLFAAISEYAPESEIVADGKLLKSRYVRKLSGYEWPTYNYAICGDCRTLTQEQALIKNVTKCRQCGKPLNGRQKRYIIPKFGFLLDNEGPKDVGLNKPERTYKGSISYIGDESQIEFASYDLCGRQILLGNNKMDRLAVLNESPFYICDTCGYGELDEKTTDRVLVKAHKTSSGHNCGNKNLRRYALGHELATDVAILKCADFDISNADAAWTILYSMLEGLSRCMNIDRNELSGCLQWYRDEQHPNGNFGFVLFDNTPGGAGYVRQLTDPTVLMRMLQEGYRIVRSCVCGGEAADTACYSCLCNYYNQRQHSVLKRQYALDFYSQFTPDDSGAWFCRKEEVRTPQEPEKQPERHSVQISFCNKGMNQAAETVAYIWENLLEDCDGEDQQIIEQIAKQCPKNIEKPWYAESVRIIETGEEIYADLMWKGKKVMLFLAENQDGYEKAACLDWKCYCTAEGFSVEEFIKNIEV
ncbi:MAG: DEAD/DEAH box helicase [Oscillospiraceae bacterium]|nr:DEAD/DEAH box helicase [Oscillospiraceae bacterium]